jgi:hypothetical protein
VEERRVVGGESFSERHGAPFDRSGSQSFHSESSALAGAEILATSSVLLESFHPARKEHVAPFCHLRSSRAQSKHHLPSRFTPRTPPECLHVGLSSSAVRKARDVECEKEHGSLSVCYCDIGISIGIGIGSQLHMHHPHSPSATQIQ